MATWQQKHPGEVPTYDYQDELRKSGMTYSQPQRGMMPEYYNQLDQARAAGAMGGMRYNNVVPTREQWESFSERNKENAKIMHLAQQQGNVPMDKLKQLIDSNAALSNQRSQYQQAPVPQQLSPLSTYRDKPWAQNYTAAIKANQDASTDYADMSLSLDPTSTSLGRYNTGTGSGPPKVENWYDDLWKGAKDLGIKGWGEIGIGAMNAYTGWQETEMAKKQHALAQETFDFQKAAYQQDRQGRVLAYNTNAQNVNAWKEAQGRTDLNKLMV